MFRCFFSFAIILLLCVFANILHVYFTCLPALAVIIYHQILFFFFMFILILTKMLTALKVITTLWMIWVTFSNLVFFLKVWFYNWSNTKLRLLVNLIVSVLLFLHKHIKTSDHYKVKTSCSKHEILHLIILILARIFCHWKPN